MAQISSYPSVTPQLGDNILGSNVYDSVGNAVKGNPTVQFSFTNVKTLLNQQYVEKLSASSTVSPLTPGNNNTGLSLVFGPAQGTSDSDVMIDAAGKVTFNAIGSYSIQQVYYAGANAASGNIIFNFKTIQDGATQVGPTSTHSFVSASNNSRERIVITSLVNITQKGIYYNFWVQNPTSGATGFLAGQTVDGSWATAVPSAQIIITKIQ